MDIVKRVRDSLKIAIEAERENRARALEDLKFADGDQWPAAIKTAREQSRRPCLTINKTDSFVRQAVNNMREQRPRITVHAVAGGADKQKANVLAGLVRHIQVASNADVAYDTAADHQVRIGFGYWRVNSKYEREDSFQQELTVDRIRNPFTVYLDPAHTLPDGSDAEWAIVTTRISKDQFEADYPGKHFASLINVGSGDDLHEWAGEKETRIAEYYWIERKPDVLLQLSNGGMAWKSDLARDGLAERYQAAGISVVNQRDSYRRQLKWAKVSAVEVLDERDLPGYWIPIIPVYGSETEIDGKIHRSGMVRALMDPQRMYNYWRTMETEVVALAPKAPWVVAEGQIEGHEDEWNSANSDPYAYLTYKNVVDPVTGVAAPPPMRQSPMGMPAAQVNAAMGASEDMKAVAGMFDPALGAPGQETSGTMVQQRQKQSDLSNFHFYDNLCVSMRHTGRILVDLIPHYYNEPDRVVRIIGEDGVPTSTKLNQQQPDPETQAITQIMNDVTVGEYDVVVDTGPGYQTKLQQAAQEMMSLLATPLGEKVVMVADDIMMRQFDWPGADMIADRMAAANPLAGVEKEIPDDVPDQAKALIAHQAAAIQNMQKQMQNLQMELKYKTSIEQGWQQIEIQKTQMQDATKRHDIQTKAVTARDIEEIRGWVELMANHMNIPLQLKQAANRDLTQ